MPVLRQMQRHAGIAGRARDRPHSNRSSGLIPYPPVSVDVVWDMIRAEALDSTSARIPTTLWSAASHLRAVRRRRGLMLEEEPLVVLVSGCARPACTQVSGAMQRSAQW